MTELIGSTSERMTLQNAANNIECYVHIKKDEDKRKTVNKYFLTRNGETVSPDLDYNQMNHFILGWLEGQKLKTVKNFLKPKNYFLFTFKIKKQTT